MLRFFKETEFVRFVWKFFNISAHLECRRRFFSFFYMSEESEACLMTPGNYTLLNWRRTCASCSLRPACCHTRTRAVSAGRAPSVVVLVVEVVVVVVLLVLVVVVYPSHGAFSIMREPPCAYPVSACLRLGRASCVLAERSGGPRAASTPSQSPPLGYGCGFWLWDVSLVRCGAPLRQPGTPETL